jgi:hypothetical protein
MIWPRKFTQIALVFTFTVLFIHFALFPQYGLPWGLLVFGISVIVLFFNAMTFYTRKWRLFPDKSFVKSLFITSFFIKVVFLACTLLLIIVVDPKSYPFEIGGGDDSRYYDRAGSAIADGMFKTDLQKSLRHFYADKADFGYPTYVGFVYYIFGRETLLLRLLSILFSCFTVVMIYKLARNIYNEEIGRLAGIMAMLIPVMLWFDTMAVKESIMTFLIVLTLYIQSEIIQSRKINIAKILFLATGIFLLFFFRLFLVGLLSLVTAVFFLLNLSNRRISRVTVLAAFLIIIIVLSTIIVESGSLEEFKVLMTQSQTQLEGELENAALGRGVSYQRTLIIPFLLAGAIVTPFPSLLYFDEGQLTMVSHYFNELVRNCLYFFGFLGIWISYKKYFRKSSLVVLYTFGYIFVLAVAGKSFQDRFQFPAFPGMLILIAVGLVQGKKYFSKWPLYLFVIGLAILAWNLFKLSIRGLL